ncbi:Hypothetical protein SRAE_0000049500 [Strongyloides ratti]|uniref:Uncharacterized protein n=1 Tax=Strongyloides ratti TaxID=34506 RepID=A0A090L1L2_STRRB|nr:Hypothetical protein SRAE_0000049500 [Strongyloides ratti]CEF61369.1 Hypothetical protein SRAE_0000049500 [Strongyloides ratti]
MQSNSSFLLLDMGAQPRQFSAILNQALCKANIQKLDNRDALLELIEVLTLEEISKIQALLPPDTNDWSSDLLMSCAHVIDNNSKSVRASIYSQFVDIILHRFDPRECEKANVPLKKFLLLCTYNLPTSFAEMKLKDVFDQLKLIQIMGNKSRLLFT